MEKMLPFKFYVEYLLSNLWRNCSIKTFLSKFFCRRPAIESMKKLFYQRSSGEAFLKMISEISIGKYDTLLEEILNPNTCRSSCKGSPKKIFFQGPPRNDTSLKTWKLNKFLKNIVYLPATWICFLKRNRLVQAGLRMKNLLYKIIYGHIQKKSTSPHLRHKPWSKISTI